MTNLTKQEEEICLDLGAALSGVTQTKTASTLKPSESNDLSRALAKAVSKYASLRTDKSEFNSISIIMDKIASTSDEDWNSFCDEAIDDVVKLAATIPLISAGVGATAGLVTPVLAQAAAMTPRIVSGGIPVAGQVVGGGVNIGEHALNQDELETEKLKALIAKYKMLTAKLDREIKLRNV